MLQEIEKLNSQMHHLDTDNWLHHDLFTYQWWIILGMNAILFGLFIIIIDRKRVFQMTSAYMICFLIVCVSDELGEYFGLWSYPHQLIPFASEFDAVEFAVIPATFTILYQLFETWRKYIIASLVVSLAYGFIGVPIFVHLGITKLSNWNYYYSFLVLFATTVLVKLITDSIAGKYRNLEHLERDAPKLTFNPFPFKKKAR